MAVAGILATSAVLPAVAQTGATAYRDEFLRHFEQSSGKLTQLAAAIPESLYTWSPGAGVMSVAQVYMHIARYNFDYPKTSLGIAPPAGIDVPNLESIRDKTTVTRILAASIQHVRDNVRPMTEAQLNERTRLYNRDVAKWAVLMQLIAHMNEHVGQSIAYARENGIVPPWSAGR